MLRLLRKKRTESMGEREERDGAITGARGGLPDLWRYLRPLWMAGRGVFWMTQDEFTTFVESKRKRAIYLINRTVPGHGDDVFQETVVSFLIKRGDPPVPEFAKYPSPREYWSGFRGVFWKRLRSRLATYVQERRKGVWGEQAPLQKWDDVAAPELAVPVGMELTPRQYQVLELLAKGMTEAMIAMELGISQPAVSRLKARALRRLRGGSRG